MSGVFGAFEVSRSGLHVFRTWMDAVSDNVANISTVRPMSASAFQERLVVAQAKSGGGAEVGQISLGDPQGRVAYEPSNPLADANGYVRYPSTDLSEQMVAMIAAQRAYQANLAVIDRAKDAYEQALQIGA